MTRRGSGRTLTGPGTACTDTSSPTVCEAGPDTSVLVTSNTPLTDVIIGSVQSDAERFEVFTSTSTSGAPATQLGGAGFVFTSVNCTAANGGSYDGNACTLNLPAGTVSVGLYDLTGVGNAASDTLLSAVSYNAVPAPPIGRGLPVVLAIGGILLGTKLWGRSKNRRMLATAAA